MNTQPIRICYQSYVDYENGKTYWDTLGAYLKKITYPGTTIDIRGITPFDSYAHSLVEMRCAREMICNAVAAEREGYDAFIVGHFQDAGLYEARAVVDIPVVSLGESSMLYSCQLAQRIGVEEDDAASGKPAGGSVSRIHERCSSRGLLAASPPQLINTLLILF